MAKKTTKERIEERPPSSELAFFIGLLLFGSFLCPAGVLLSYSISLHSKLSLIILQSLTLGCFLGLAMAIIPAFIFMHLTMKKLKKK